MLVSNVGSAGFVNFVDTFGSAAGLLETGSVRSAVEDFGGCKIRVTVFVSEDSFNDACRGVVVGKSTDFVDTSTETDSGDVLAVEGNDVRTGI